MTLAFFKEAAAQRHTPAQSHAIALDYALRRGSAEIPVRRAHLFYALRRLGLDVAPAAVRREQHIVLVNLT